jgi:hypothetical protein
MRTLCTPGFVPTLPSDVMRCPCSNVIMNWPWPSRRWPRRGPAAAGPRVVSGLPGVGRSALLDAVTRTHPAEDFLLLCADGTAAEQDVAFGVVQQLLQPLVRAAARRGPRPFQRGLTASARYHGFSAVSRLQRGLTASARSHSGMLP